jgi:hypothetical protein
MHVPVCLRLGAHTPVCAHLCVYTSLLLALACPSCCASVAVQVLYVAFCVEEYIRRGLESEEQTVESLSPCPFLPPPFSASCTGNERELAEAAQGSDLNCLWIYL